MSSNTLPRFDSQTKNRFVLMASCAAKSNVVINVNYNELQNWYWSCGDVEYELYESKEAALQGAVVWLKHKLLIERQELKARLAEVDALLGKIG
jgi:hypothetical protein